MAESSDARTTDERAPTIKCVVWDLDNTVWDGILLEHEGVTLRPHVADVIRTLDERGILHSVASRNAPVAAERLRQFGLDEYFLHPQINWNAKSRSIEEIAKRLRLALDTFAFVDDDPFELSEVAFAHPEVLCLDAADVSTFPALSRMRPSHVTDEARRRRLMYLGDARRQAAEEAFAGTSDEFLATLAMRFRIARVADEELDRAEELTVRTHQLNTTGYTYSRAELEALRNSPDHLLLIAELEDRFGAYGKIGLSLVECGAACWTIKLLLMSCRVMGRGVGSAMLTHIMLLAQQAGVRLRAEFVPNDRNRMMFVTYKFAGFKEIARQGPVVLLQHELARVPALPAYLQIDAVAV